VVATANVDPAGDGGCRVQLWEAGDNGGQFHPQPWNMRCVL